MPAADGHRVCPVCEDVNTRTEKLTMAVLLDLFLRVIEIEVLATATCCHGQRLGQGTKILLGSGKGREAAIPSINIQNQQTRGKPGCYADVGVGHCVEPLIDFLFF